MLHDARGGMCRVELRSYPIFDHREQFDGVVLLLRDVEERLAAEARIRFQSWLLNAVGQAVIATDPSGTVLYWNVGAERLVVRRGCGALDPGADADGGVGRAGGRHHGVARARVQLDR